MINSSANTYEIVQLPCLDDNYCSLIHHSESGQTAVVDTPDGEEIIAQLEQRGWQLTHILTTHHHWDHIGGHEQLKRRYNCTIVAPQKNRQAIPDVDHWVQGGEQIAFADMAFEVIATPGHTLGHVVYYAPALAAVFVGDTLFSMGCGRLFEGSAQQMWDSISRIMQLPPQTMVYCGHEYTQANADFALTIEPQNPDLLRRIEDVRALRAEGRPTVPTALSLEMATNPFMRAAEPTVQQSLMMLGQEPSKVFAEIRLRKDRA